jgi:tRNA(Ile)-lysidine synthase
MPGSAASNAAELTATAADRVDALLDWCTFPPAGTAVVCAVSGGADSTALAALAVAAGCHVSLMHVDHGLRPTSAQDADVVRSTGQRLGVDVTSVRIELADGPNLEARARDARYAALPAGALTGHTADDQAETMLLNLMRGASAGMTAMRPGHTRPLLALRRSDTVWVCATWGLSTVTDESNVDPRFLRNRVRHEVLPLLQQVSGRDVVPVLTRQSELWRDDNDLLDQLAGALDPTDAKALSLAPRALARRAVRHWLTAECGMGHPPDLASIDRVMEVATGSRVACEVAGGLRVQRRRQRLSVGPRLPL